MFLFPSGFEFNEIDGLFMFNTGDIVELSDLKRCKDYDFSKFQCYKIEPMYPDIVVKLYIPDICACFAIEMVNAICIEIWSSWENSLFLKIVREANSVTKQF